MLSKVVTFALFASMAAAKSIDLDNYTFEKYLADFKLKFHPSELTARRTAFATELARVKAHNAKNLSWKESMNKHSVLSHKEKAAFKGRHKGKARVQEKMLKNQKPLPADFKMLPLETLPKHVDWRTKGKKNLVLKTSAFFLRNSSMSDASHCLTVVILFLPFRRCHCREGPGLLRFLLGFRFYRGD